MVVSMDQPNATNEPTDAGENETNEANNSPLSVVRGPLSVVGDMLVSMDQPTATNEATDAGENVTNEATAACENLTNEPKLGDESEGSQTTDQGQLTTDNPQEVESYEQGVARRKAAREETTRRLNEEARKEAEAAMAMRRARIREQKQKSAKPGNQPKGRETRTGQGSKKETAAREMKQLNDLVAMMLGPYQKTRRAPS
jgi:hypothetical protein